jgi:hypothetical protein
LEARFVEEVAADGPGLRDAKDILGGVARVCPGGEVEVADAEIAAARTVALIAGAERVRFGQRVIDSGREVGAIRGPPDAGGEIPLRQRGVDRLRVVGVDAVAREREAGPILLDRSTERERTVLLLLGRLPRRKCIARVE